MEDREHWIGLVEQRCGMIIGAGNVTGKAAVVAALSVKHPSQVRKAWTICAVRNK
jgi:hypothetical protein